MTTTPLIRASQSFGQKKSDDALVPFSSNVLVKLFNEVAFTNPPLTPAQLEALITSFAEAKAAQPTSGKPGTALKNEKRAALVAGLRELAFYVQVTSANNLATLLSSGFDAVSTNRAQSPLAKPSVERIVSGQEGQSLVTLSSNPNKRGCEIEVAEVAADGTPGPYRAAVYSNGARNVVISGLIPGKLYVYRGRLLGGSMKRSDWSDPIMQRAA